MSELNSDLLFFVLCVCFDFVVLGGPGGGLGGFLLGSLSSGLPLLLLPTRKPPKQPPGPKNKTKQNDKT